MVRACCTIPAADGSKVAQSGVAEVGVDTEAGEEDLDGQWDVRMH